MQCFVCSEELVGDSQYIEHHINSCLDRQGSSSQLLTAPLVTPASLDASHRDTFTASSRIQPSASPRSAYVDADHALALALAQAEEGVVGAEAQTNGLDGGSFSRRRERMRNDDAFEQDRLLALALSREEEGRSAAEGNTSDVCPSCGSSWATFDLSFPPAASFAQRSVLIARRRNHLAKCEGMDRRAMSWSPPVGENHGEADLDDELAEEKGRSSLAGKGKRPRSGPLGGGAKETVVGTAGMIGLLHHALSASHASPHGRTREAYLANEWTEHIATRLGDYGWGCGYKNAQMVFSAVRHLPQYSTDSNSPGQAAAPVPPIRAWQETVEEAWRQGYDPAGAEHFRGKLIGSRRWIGTTEVYTALTYMGVNAFIVDFPKQDPDSGVVTNKALVEWILDYFRSSSTSAQPAATNAFALLSASQGTSIHLTGNQPLYLQHKGHSRTIVGVEVRKSASVGGGGGGRGRAGSEGEEEVWLLVFDPGRPIPNDIKAAAASFKPASSTDSTNPAIANDTTSVSSSSSTFPPLKKFKPSRGGFGLSSSPKKQNAGASSGASVPKFSDVLKCVRVNMHDLKKKDEYQILYVSATEPPLTELQKLSRKLVTATLGVPKAPAKNGGGGPA
ncbi:hypothetical protein NBRC10512_005136 [Rhodotorula toruloides]|uniref:RHTO0S02e14378g1_1 n=2 Tax=Rhodotorula toruloides TaxID=5286 RepID=A0A061AIK1_RHOTO|nr:zinc finger with UFM1-specific peptidase domain protein [Rhodotorula toruloides NP11]EMS23409.1 zinc finger with UFM1-specific peptidase domain protein [Rhodotorula toruloides NP11]CDR37400.1 RHTO0S02e14378g1_1 [Rhodotorula toruloides]